MSLFDSLGQLWSRKSPSKKSAPRRKQRKGDSKRGLLFEGLEERSMLAITQIALSNFTAPRVLDFQSVPTGPIATNAAAFQAIGISSVFGTSDADIDSYSTGSPTASRALAATSTGLRVIDPNSGNASDRFGNNNAYTINFAQPQTKFGFTNDDSGGSGFTFNIVLFSGATQVDSGSLSAPVFGQNPLYFSSTVAFDRVVISNGIGDGFVIDNLTTETPGPQVTISPGTASINENDVASATITITNPDPTDVHSANINWGEGTPDTITGLGLTDTSGTVGATGYTWTASTRTLVVTHRYLDDNPTGTTSDNYTITAKVADDDMSGNFNGTVGVDYVQATTTILVRNVVASYATPPGVSNPVFENGLCFINGTLSDPGTQDTFRFQVSWGDGTVDVISVGAASSSGTIGGTNYSWNAGLRAYSFSHRYLDDTPTDTVDIAVRLADDDMTGNFAGTNGVDFTLVGGTISLLNSPPSLGPISVLNSPITEGGTANASLIITDSGTLDVFTANVNWGQGTPDTITGLGLTNTSGTVGATSYVWIAATRVLNVTHQYPNDTVFTGNTNYTLTVKVADDDMTGNFAGAAGSTNYVERTTTITVIDDEGLPPQITAPNSINVTEDQASTLSGISFTAAGTGSVAVTATFSVPSGTLTATSSGNVTVNGSGTGSLTLNGTPADINSFISASNLKFQTALNQTSTVTLTIGINDNGSGGAPAQSASTTVALNVNPVNDNPINTVPFISTNEDTPVNVTGFSISDVDSTGPFSVNVRFNNVAAGILTFRTDVPGGLTAANILNNGTPNTTILGASLVAINATLSALNGLVYTPAANFNGLALFAVDTNSDGNGGSDVGDTATWTVSAVNDAPTITAPATFAAQQGITASLTGISFADVDAGAGSVTVQLGVASGTLTAASSGGVTVGGSGTGLVTLSGTIASINTFLSGSNVSYTNSSRGAVTLTITINDNGNVGAGPAQTTMTTSTINVAETPSLVVTTNNDGSTSFDGLISLREAIAYANGLPGADTITFGDGTATGGTNFLDSTADTITIGAIGDGTAGPSAFGITSDITIQGNATTGITLQGGGSNSNLRAFYVASAGTLTLQNLTIDGFRHLGGGSNRGGGAAGMGGAIFVNGGTLNLLATTIANNAAEGGALGSFSDGGGGLGGDAIGQFGGGGPNAFGSDVNNGASGGFGGGGNAYGGNGGFGGGGAYSGTGGFGGGGGVFTAGGFGAGNGGMFGPGGGAGMGGAIFSNGGTINISNSTFNQNAAIGGAFITFNSGQGLGGVLFARNGSVTINNSTLSGNTAADGGQGVYVLSDASNGGNNTSPGSGSATVVINNTIIGQADNSISDFVANTNAGGATPVTSGVGNLIRNAVGFGGTIVSSSDPQLAALANNGGPTQTMALAAGSPARDVGVNSAIPNGLTTDQRGTGFTRNFGGTVDIGAFEINATAPSVTSPTKTNITANSATLGGNVTTDNGAAITERGILLAKTSVNNNPQLNGNGVTKIVATGTTGVFTVDATGLDFTTGYSYVAFATNVEGTTYTAVDTFTTLATLAALNLPVAGNIQTTSANIGGILTDTGGSPVTEFGFVYAKTADELTPQIGEANVTKVAVFTNTINNNAGFTRPLSGLEPGTQYSLTTYAINSVGTSYSTSITFTTLATSPTVTAPTATNVAVTTATLGGNVTADGGATITERGIVYAITSVNGNPQIGGAGVTKVPTTGTTGVFTIDVSAIPSGKTISFAAYATNAVGTSYSTVGSFTTAPAVGQLGGVTVQVIGNQLVITGDNKPDRLSLTGTANPNEFIVSGLYGTVVNGVTNSSVTAQGITSIQWNLTNGGDLIVMDNANVAGNVTIGGGSGAKGIALGNSGPVRVGGNLAIDGGANNGSIVVNRTTTVGGLSIIGGLGVGLNSITTSNSTIGTNLSIIGGPGPDQIQQTQVTVNGQWNISASSGNDVIAVNSCIALGAATFNSGLGTDVIAVGGGRFDAGLTLDGSTGGGVKKLSMSGVVYTGTATLRGGEQSDLIVFTGNLGGKAVFDTAGGLDNVLVQYSILDELFAALGDGNDVFNLRGNRIKGLTSLDGGPGSNVLINTGNIFQGPVQRNRI